MSKVRNATDGPREVPLLGRMVQPGEVVEVPDFQPAHTDGNPLPIVWPPPTWETVPDDTPLGLPTEPDGGAATGADDESGDM